MSAFATAILVALLCLISVQDIKTMRIPDKLNAHLALSGAAWWIATDASQLGPQVATAVLASGLLWAVRLTHTRITGRIGLGLGDVKLIGAGMIWIDPHLFPLLLFTASAAGLVGALAFSYAGTTGIRRKYVPFGPYLAFGILVCWFLEMAR